MDDLKKHQKSKPFWILELTFRHSNDTGDKRMAWPGLRKHCMLDQWLLQISKNKKPYTGSGTNGQQSDKFIWTICRKSCIILGDFKNGAGLFSIEKIKEKKIIKENICKRNQKLVTRSTDIEQGLTSQQTHYRSYRGRVLYSSKDPTNSVKALKEESS